MRRTVAEIIAETIRGLPLTYPRLSAEEREEMLVLRKELAED